MLKGISPLLSPELLKVLAEMGHGDRLVIGDANFAAAAMAREHILVRADGVPSDALAGAVLELFPLDEWAPAPVILMGVKDGNGALQPLDQCRKIRQAARWWTAPGFMSRPAAHTQWWLPAKRTVTAA